MTQLQQIYNKYNQNWSTSLDKILTHMNMIKPVYKNSLEDIYDIMKLGTCIYNVRNFQMWKVCPNLINEIIDVNTLYANYNINEQDIINIVNQAIIENIKPSSVTDKVYSFVCESLRKHVKIGNIIDINNYFDMKTKYNDSLTLLNSKYIKKWNKLEKKHDMVENAIYKHIDKLNNDENFIKMTNMIDSIGKETTLDIKELIKNIVILIKPTVELSPSLQIKLYFDKKMDEIYEKVIASKDLSKTDYDFLLNMYSVEKEMHRLSLSVEYSKIVLSEYTIANNT